MTEYVGYKDQIGEGLYNMGLTDERIVRCRDCKHFTPNDKFLIEPPNVPFSMIVAMSDSCDFWAGTKCKAKPDGFCKWGEPRGELVRDAKGAC
jgi:hypothetical protein